MTHSATERVPRLIADVCDVVVCCLIAMAVIFGANLWMESSAANVATGISVTRILALLAIVCYLLVPAFFGGRTIGKWVMGLAIVDSANRHPSPNKLLLRQGLAIVPLCVAFAWNLALGLTILALNILAEFSFSSAFGHTGGIPKRWYDLVSDTAVVQIGTPLIRF
jgi:uncharacterized RDD family membrane protein YckC